MKKITLFYILLLAGPLLMQAQVAINTDASLPNASSILDVKSTTKGFLAPRLTTAQRTVIGTPADGLWVYDTDTKSFWYYKNGTGWQEITGNAALVLPYSANVSSNAPLFALTNGATGGAIVGTAGTGGSGIWGLANNIGGAGLLGDNQAAGEGVTGRTKSSAIPTAAVVGRNDGAGYGVSGFIAADVSGTGIGVLGRVGISGSTGTAGHFENINGSNTGTALEALTNGVGMGASVINTNPSNVSNILQVTTTGPGVIADHSKGNAGNFFTNNTSGVGAGVRGEVNSIFGNNGTAGVYGVASGTGGYGGYFEHSNTTGFGLALEVTNAGLGRTAEFQTTQTTNAQATITASTVGTGGVAAFRSSNTSSTVNALNVTANGPGVIADHSQGNAGNFFMNNTSGVGAGVRGEVNSIFGNSGTAGVYGVASGTGGYGGYFEHSNATGFGLALEVTNAGLGRTANFLTTQNTNAQATISASTLGTGGVANFISSNTSSTANTINVTANGPGVIANHALGNAGNFFMNNTGGVGAGVRGEVNSIFGNNGTAGVYGVSSGTGGYGGYFEHSNATGFGITLYAISAGQGNVFVANHTGSSGDLALFQTGGANVARISRGGRGFFNGGTQNSGADLAEAFDVTGTVTEYEPGDVLAISVDADRTVQKSQEAYSSLVVGVYATKPGVLLTEESVDSNLEDKVPMGVVGVIPTKVCNENGAIRRGDILVTASRPGYAMKADLSLLKPGQAIGKALQEFDGETGKIKVLVNVR